MVRRVRCSAGPPVLKTHHGRTQPMTKHDEARRAFLLGAAVGAGAVAGATLVPTRSRRRLTRARQEPEPAPPIRLRAAQGSAHSSTAKTPPPLWHLPNG